jgi:GxxExxY protein
MSKGTTDEADWADEADRLVREYDPLCDSGITYKTIRTINSQDMARAEFLEESLTRSAIGAFFEVYNTLGFGFLEHVYVRALEYELSNRGHNVSRELTVAVMYKGIVIARQRLDLVVDGKLIVETKSTYELHSAATRQLHNYLRATSFEVGLLFHFGPKPVFHRLIFRNDRLNHPVTAPPSRINQPHQPNPPHLSHPSTLIPDHPDDA